MTESALQSAADGDASSPSGSAPPSPPRPRIQSVARAGELLFGVAQSPDGLTSRELTEQLGMSRQGTYHLIQTLTSIGLLVRTESDRYVLGARVGTLAAAFERHLAAGEHLAPHARAVARRSGETAYAAGWRNGEIVVLAVAAGTNAVQASQVVPGTAEDAHSRASGKLLLAQCSPAVLADYLEQHPLRPRTSKTITNRRRFDEELERIRRQGYAVDDEEFADGLSCMAVPFDGLVSPFVLGLSLPSERFHAREPDFYVDMVRDSAWTSQA